LHSETIFSINSFDLGAAIRGLSFLKRQLDVKAVNLENRK